jgi:DNA polymerase-3 subunit chi
MTRVDFYVLQSGAGRERDFFACRLAEKAWRLGHAVYVHTPSPGDTRRLDELLWTFRDGSFLPHLPLEDAAQADPGGATPVLVGHGDEPGPQHELLINLAEEVPLFFSRFDRVAEIVAGDAPEGARERFRFYRDRGYELNTHKL